MKKHLVILLSGLLALSIIGCSKENESVAEESKTETKMLTVSHVFATDHPVAVAYDEAAAELLEKTDGRYGLTVYPNGTYANYNDSITSVQMGDVDIASLDSASNWLESAGVLLAPYAFDSYDHWKNFKESDLREEISTAIEEAVGDIVQLNMFNFGFRNLTANKEIKGLEDFAGLTLRCVNFEPYSTLKDVFDVAITSIPIEDVYMSLQTGVADAQENPYTQIVTMKFYEVQDYLMKTQHFLAVSSTIMNEDLWNSLSSGDQAIFQEVFTNFGNRIDQLTVEKEQALEQICVDNGMTIINNVDITPYKANAAKVVAGKPAWVEWYNAIQEYK